MARHLTVARIAEGLSVAWNTASDAVLAGGKRALTDDTTRFGGVTAIGAGEHVRRPTRRGDTYVTVITGLTGIRDGTSPARLPGMVQGRSRQAFTTWLSQRPEDWRDGTEVVAMDGFTGYKTAANLVTYEPRFYEGAYLLGVLAGMTTKSNTLGYVGSFPIPEGIRNIDAFTLGARSVNPKATTKVIWVDTWYDPGKERQAAEALIAQGADVLCQNTDSPAIVQAAEQHGVHAFGWDSDMLKYGPHAQLTANTENWADYYIDEARQVMAGTWTGERHVANGLKENMVVLMPLNKSVPPETARLFEEKKRAIIDGALSPFSGPLKDNAGVVKLAAGSTLTNEQLMSINWFVDGIDGSMPK